MEKVEIKFVVDIVGHDEATIMQMYKDWLASSTNNNIQPEPAMPKIAELKFIQFNLNDEVKFKWTEEGKRQYIQYYEKLGIKPIYPKTDEKGFYRLQMWEFMHVFGKEMYNGCEQSIDKNEILIAILHN